MLLLTSAIWGSSFVAQDISLRYIGPITLNAVRMLLGAAILIPVTLIFSKSGKHKNYKQNKKPFFNKNELKGGIVCGLLLFISSNLQQIGMSAYGDDEAAAGKAGFITALYIIIVPLLGLFVKKRPSLTVWLSVAISFLGLYLLCFKGGHINILADGIIALCAVSFSFHILVVDKFSPGSNGIKLSMLQFTVAGILSLCCLLIPSETQLLTSQNFSSALPGILYLAVLSCGVAYTLQIVAQKRITDATVASVLMSLESVFAVLTGLLFGEHMSFGQIIGCILMFAAVMLAQIDFSSIKRSITSKRQTIK